MVKVDTRKAIGELFEDGFPTVDMDKMSKEERRAYAVQAGELLSMPVFRNEINQIIDSTIKEIALTSQSYEEVHGLRMSINGIKAFKERLIELATGATEPKPRDPVDLHGAI